MVERDAKRVTRMRRPRPPMPGELILVSVIWAIWTALGLLPLLDSSEAETGLILGSLLVWIPIYVALLRGHPLAHQAGRIFSLVWIILGGLGLLGLVMAGDRFVAGATWPVLLALGVSSLVFWAVGTRRARRFFDLECRSCGSQKVRPRSILYNAIQCRDCERRWRWREEEVDVAAFE